MMVTKASKQAEEPPKAKPVSKEPLTDLNSQGVSEATPGGWVEVVKGEHKGAYGSFLYVFDYTKDGQPNTCVVRTRDENSQPISVNYGDLVPSVPGKR